MSSESQMYLQGFININDQDPSRKAVLGSEGTGVYGSGSNSGVYAIAGDPNITETAYGLRAMKGYGTGSIYAEGDFHLMDGCIGVGTLTPKEKLEVNGAIKVGTRDSVGATAGTVRWYPTTAKLQVFDGANWVNLH